MAGLVSGLLDTGCSVARGGVRLHDAALARLVRRAARAARRSAHRSGACQACAPTRAFRVARLRPYRHTFPQRTHARRGPVPRRPSPWPPKVVQSQVPGTSRPPESLDRSSDDTVSMITSHDSGHIDWRGSTHNSTTRATMTVSRRARGGGVVAAAALVLDGVCRTPTPPAVAALVAAAGGFIDGGTRRRRQGRDDPRRLRWRRGEELRGIARGLREEQRHQDPVHVRPDFTTTIKRRSPRATSPDIGLFPQPGGLLEFATRRRSGPSTPSSTTTAPEPRS